MRVWGWGKNEGVGWGKEWGCGGGGKNEGVGVRESEGVGVREEWGCGVRERMRVWGWGERVRVWMCRYVYMLVCGDIFICIYCIYICIYIHLCILCKSIHLFTCLSADASSHYRSPHPVFNRRLTGEFRGTDSAYQPPYTYVPLN